MSQDVDRMYAVTVYITDFIEILVICATVVYIIK